MSNVSNIINYIQAIASEKNLDPENIFQALEMALATVTEKTLDENTHLQCEIDRNTGVTTYYRTWTVVADDAETFNSDREIRISDTKKDYEDLEIGDNIVDEINLSDNDESAQNAFGIGRIEIEKAKQVMLKAVRDAERAQQASGHEKLIGKLIHGEVSHVSRLAITLESNGIQAEISRSELIPKEIIRKGDLIQGCLSAINHQGRGPLLQLSRRSNQMLEELFRNEVPEIAEGLIQIKCSARDPGSRAKIAVKSNDLRIDPIGACIGVKGTRVQAISNELHGERIDIIKWEDDPALFAISALAPATVSSIEVNEQTHTMHIAIEESMLSQAIGRNGQNINLASQLLGWKLKIMSDDEAAEQSQKSLDKAVAIFTKQIDVDSNVAEILAQNNINTISELANSPLKILQTLDGFNKEIAEELIDRAQNQLLDIALSGDDDENSLMGVEKMNYALAEKLEAKDIHTRDDLADMSVTELIELVDINEEEAGKLILAARSHWFDEEDDNSK